MEEAATLISNYCLCYKYKDFVSVPWTDPDSGGESYDHEYIPPLPTPIVGSISHGGSLVEATDGKCEDQTFYVSRTDDTGAIPPNPPHMTPWYVGYMPTKDEINIPLPP
jgi:hypothetical protein